MIDLLKDLWDFMRVRKKFWLAPIYYSTVVVRRVDRFCSG